jgi:mannosyltransferase
MRYEERKPSQVVENFLPRHSSFITRSLLRIARHPDEGSHMATWGALIALTLVAFLLRTPHLAAQSLWRDEVDVIRLANESLPQLVRNLARAGHNGPLYYLLMRGWLKLVGEGEFALRYPSLCFGILAVPLVYRAGRGLVGGQAATLTAALVAISPYLVWYSQDAKMYALVTTLSLLAITCQLEALANGRLRCWAGFVFFASLSLYVHLLSALMIPVYLAAFVLAWPRDREQRWGGLVSLGLLILPYLPLALWQLPLVQDSYETGHPFYPIDQMLSLLFNLHARGVAMVGNWLVVAAFLFAILAGLFLSGEVSLWRCLVSNWPIVSSRIHPRLFLSLWLLLPIALIYLISLRAPVFEPRYLIFIAPAFYLLTGLGVVALSRLSWTATGLVLAIVLSFSLLGIWVQGATPIKSDFRAAASYVMARRQDDAPILFQIPYVRDTFDYYFEGEYTALEGPWTNGEVTGAQVEDIMLRVLDGHTGVWFIASESWLWDSRSLTQAWLDQHARLIESASFALVDVYHYDLPSLK